MCVGPNTQATPEGGGGLGANEGSGLRGHREIGMVVGGGVLALKVQYIC